MPSEPVQINELWMERPCPTCHGCQPIYVGMICNECGGFGFTLQLVSQTQYVNGEWVETE